MASFEVLDVEQRSEAWHQARVGLLTGSRAGDMLATTTTGPSKSRTNLRVQLALERVVGRPVGSDYQSVAMRVGQERESAALMRYEVQTGHLLHPVGFVRHTMLRAGCSPDGVVGAFQGLVEVKSPGPPQHLQTLRRGVEGISKDYRAQIDHGLWLTGAAWCDFVSYNPEFPEALQLAIVRVLRNDFMLMAYGRAVETFLAEVDEEESAINDLIMRVAS